MIVSSILLIGLPVSIVILGVPEIVVRHQTVVNQIFIPISFYIIATN